MENIKTRSKGLVFCFRVRKQEEITLNCTLKASFFYNLENYTIAPIIIRPRRPFLAPLLNENKKNEYTPIPTVSPRYRAVNAYYGICDSIELYTLRKCHLWNMLFQGLLALRHIFWNVKSYAFMIIT